MKVERLQGLNWLSLRVAEMPQAGVARALWLEEGWLKPLLNPQYRTVGVGVEADFDAREAGENVQAQGSLATRVGFTCSRCGEDAELAVEARWEEIFLSDSVRETEPSEDDEDGSDDDFGAGRIVDGKVELEPCLSEALVLALPAYPLCKDDCAGVCSGCGENLNRGACRCSSSKVDPRWQQLAALRDGLGATEEDGDA